MMSGKVSTAVLLPMLFLISSHSSPIYAHSVLDRLAIEAAGVSLQFAYTNKESAFLYGETAAENVESWQGFNVFGHEFLDDYAIYINDRKLDRASVAKAVVYPDYLERTYSHGITEEVRLPDGVALFAVTITSNEKPVSITLAPLFTDGRSSQDFVIEHRPGTALIARPNHLVRTTEKDYPVWLAVYGEGFSVHGSGGKRGNQFSPLIMKAKPARSHTIIFAVADTKEVAYELAKDYAHNAGKYIDQRRARMEKLLSETLVETEDLRFNKALAWAKLSLDALIMNQVTRGIFAGLPWFNNYWGRDTFISLPGAALVTGRFSEARQILRSFAAFQNTDTNSTDYGRIPNIVTTTDKAYNTADGTPRFVMMAREYADRSGDTSFTSEIYPIVRRSIDGTLQYHTDSLGFLTHGDAETWMDAVGPDGPWSPRGNRANDVQALWILQLDAGIWFATRRLDEASAKRWQLVADRCRSNLKKLFVNVTDGTVYDHLNTDGTADIQVRPNQIFVSQLLDDALRAHVLSTLVNKLTYEYGVASLSQEDENFHPFHQNGSLYPKDAAYHNGTVWTWLQGAVISELCYFGKQEVANRITANSVHQILERGAVGTQSELLDAVPRHGKTEPALSGTFSQAWNLAEFIRNFYDDYLGIRISRLQHILYLKPGLPKSMGNVRAVINLDGTGVPIEIQQKPHGQIVTINSQGLRVGGKGVVELIEERGRALRTTFALPPKSIMRLALKNGIVTLTCDGIKHDFTAEMISSTNHDSILDSLTFVTPSIRPGLKALKGPDHPLLTHEQVKAEGTSARTLFDATDPTGDDSGVTPSAHYVYPRNPDFVPGSFDITRFAVSCDSVNAYFTLKFRTLSNPGWHPEYGFQLTYAAIAIDQDGKPGSGSRHIGHNSRYVLDERHAYERLILIGGGAQIEDQQGKILAAYRPVATDMSKPLGDQESGVIRFAIPMTYLGRLTDTWTFTLLAGAQDDHGGAGIGEFRTVNREAGEWNGGGKEKADDPNIYDMLVAPQR